MGISLVAVSASYLLPLAVATGAAPDHRYCDGYATLRQSCIPLSLSHDHPPGFSFPSASPGSSRPRLPVPGSPSPFPLSCPFPASERCYVSIANSLIGDWLGNWMSVAAFISCVGLFVAEVRCTRITVESRRPSPQPPAHLRPGTRPQTSHPLRPSPLAPTLTLTLALALALALALTPAVDGV